MKKALLLIAFIAGTSGVFAQGLSKEMTIALKNDDVRAISSLVNDSNKDACLVSGSQEYNLLQYSAMMKSNDIAVYLIQEAKADVNGTCNNMTPLMMAAKAGNSSLISTLLEAGADASIKIDGKTALDYAEETKNIATIAALRK
ncbi:hypothetical protein AAT17_06950 [Nonlabens sp. MIC269]|uniref:ankyrin repeat domain-containing protein n=1 Tax=Nonlabens sp. MIC269 TaxID=1476901 RepID=UPI00071F3191|nr:ankyrin repeat domain-containing protein [Nonlabens sp. MIC269]ALM20975.1 hypothetical protein AAT17_06950 [Nonlabens sp. MIC269]